MNRACLMALVGLLAQASRAQDFDCSVQPWREVKVSAATGGLVSEVLVEVGDRVTAGMVVARLDSGLEAQAVQMAKVRLDATAGLKALKRQKALMDERVSRLHALNLQALVPDEKREETDMEMARLEATLADAELAHDTAVIDLSRASLQLQGRRVVSPFDGVVVERSLSAGEYLGDGAHVLTVTQMDPLRVIAWLPVATYGTISIGDRVTITPELPQQAAIVTQITAIPPVVDLGSGTYTVIVSLPNHDLSLPAGIKCQIGIAP